MSPIPPYLYHKLGNLASHLTATGFGAAAVYHLAEGRTGAAIFDGSMAVLAETFGYILRQDQKFYQKMDKDQEIEEQKRQQTQERWRQEDNRIQQQDLDLAYLRGKLNLIKRFNDWFYDSEGLSPNHARVGKALIRRPKWKRLITAAHYEGGLQRVLEQSLLIPPEAYRIR